MQQDFGGMVIIPASLYFEVHQSLCWCWFLSMRLGPTLFSAQFPGCLCGLELSFLIWDVSHDYASPWYWELLSRANLQLPWVPGSAGPFLKWQLISYSLMEISEPESLTRHCRPQCPLLHSTGALISGSLWSCLSQTVGLDSGKEHHLLLLSSALMSLSLLSLWVPTLTSAPFWVLGTHFCLYSFSHVAIF